MEDIQDLADRPVEVTPAMVEAAVRVLSAYDPELDRREEVVMEMLLAMGKVGLLAERA